MMSYWLPDARIDPKKFKPRRLDPDEYDAMHTALHSLHRLTQHMRPEKLQGLVGAISLAPDKGASLAKIITLQSSPQTYRTQTGGDRWACHDCKNRGDKWYMYDHHCSKSKIENLAWLRIKQGQKKAERIKKLQGENKRIA